MPRPDASTRRDFLKGKAAADALALRAVGDGRTPGDRTAERYLIHVGRRAMACQFEVYFDPRQYEAGTPWATEALDLVDRLEDQMSAYREESELSRINREAADRPFVVERRLFGLLQRADAIREATDGAFDMTSGPLSAAWGLARREGRVPGEEELANALARVAGHTVRLDADRRTIRLEERGIEINVNGIGKGYAVDRAAQWLREAGMDDFLIHGGQSSVLAAGSSRSRADGGWSVGLRHPLRPAQRLAEFYLTDRALGTSGAGTQFFHHQGIRYGHVIDPRTGRPVDSVYGSTALAPSAAEADALATAFLVMGPESAARYCESHTEVAMVLVCPGRQPGAVELVTAGLDERQWRVLSPK